MGSAMFADGRSKRVIFVAHCILNQNAKIDRCARCPGAMRELAAYLVESGLGIVQMPCPELVVLGLDRQADPSRDPTIESEDTRVAARMREAPARAACWALAADVAHQIAQYLHHGFEVVGLLGINGSPTCGVETNWRDGEEPPGPGVFIESLRSRLESDGAEIPFRGVKAYDPRHAVSAARELQGRSR